MAGIDLEAIKKKIAQLNGTAKGGSGVWWRPKQGEYVARIVPWQDTNGQPFKEMWYYYGIGRPNAQGKGPFPMPTLKQFNKPDPIQDLINSLRKEDADKGTDDNKELCKKLYPKMKAFIPVIVRGEEGEGVRLWALTPKLYEKILGFFVDSEITDTTPDFTDVKNGRDLKVKVSPSGKMFQNKPVMDVDANYSIKISALSADPAQAKKWMESIPTLTDADPAPTFDEMKKRLEEWFAHDAKVDTSSEGTDKGSNVGADLDALSEQLSVKPAAQKAEVETASDESETSKPTEKKKAAKSSKKTEDVGEELDSMLKELQG